MGFHSSSSSTPVKTPAAAASKSQAGPPSATGKKHPPLPNPTALDMDSVKSRFEAYNRLQAAAVAFGEKLPIPEIVALGGQSDGKSSLLEALLGFRFNIREVEMGTRRPLMLQMVHDPSASEPRCRFQDEDSDEYGSPVVAASTIADLIRSRTDAHLKKVQAAVSSKPIVMRAEYAHCPNLTIIDTPGFVLKAKKGEPDNTPAEIMAMVKSLASPPHRILLFLQQSSVEWCSSLWLDAVREIDPSFRRTIVVVSKFDNRLKEFTDKWEVDQYLSAGGYLGDNARPFFVALPKDRGTVPNEEFRRQISQVDADILRHLRENVKGGFDAEKFGPFIGFGCLKEYLEAELQKRYKVAAPATLALLEQRCVEVSSELARIDSKLQATSDVAHLRRTAMLYVASICNHVSALIEGAADPPPEHWGRTTCEEQMESGIGSWPGVTTVTKPPNASLKLYGGAAFERVMHEFQCAAYSIDCPQVSREKVANILLAYAGRGGSGGASEAAAEIARAAARSWLSPLLDTACDRLAFVLRTLFDLAIERIRVRDSTGYSQKNDDMDGYIGFHASLRRSYNLFIQNLSKQCKQLVRHHLDSVTSPYSSACYERDTLGLLDCNSNSLRQMHGSTFFLDLSETTVVEGFSSGEENVPPQGQNKQQTTPAKGNGGREALRESQLTVPETPSPDQPADAVFMTKKENGNCLEIGRKRQARFSNTSKNSNMVLNQDGNFPFASGNIGCLKSGSAYTDICGSAARYFARMRQVLIERNVPSTLNSGFLTPCRDHLVVSLGLDLFAISDEKFMDMFVAPGAVDVLQSDRHSLHKRQKILQSCLSEFKNIARVL